MTAAEAITQKLTTHTDTYMKVPASDLIALCRGVPVDDEVARGLLPIVQKTPSLAIVNLPVEQLKHLLDHQVPTPATPVNTAPLAITAPETPPAIAGVPPAGDLHA